MSTKYTGGFITKSPVAPTTTAASGVWTLDQQQQAQKAGTWPSPPIFIEDLFSTYLYTGTGATQTVTNGIDLAGQGGLVWAKIRSGFNSPLSHALFDTSRGVLNRLASNLSDAQASTANSLTAFNSTGFTVGSSVTVNGGGAGDSYVSWTFRKQPKFFDIVTYTGNNATGRTISHNLGSVPGCIIVRRYDTIAGWDVYHRSLGASQAINLQGTGAAFADSIWNSTSPTSTVFTVSGSANTSGGTYVAYLFAHDAGGFPVSGGGSTNGISCGSFTTDASGLFSVTLGYEPQWVMVKRTTGVSDWTMFDTMRGMPTAAASGIFSATLLANTTAAEAAAGGTVGVNATGFNSLNGYLASSSTFIYIAIRRGPMKVPTTGTSVFGMSARSGTGANATVTGGQADDAVLVKNRGSAVASLFSSRLTGTGYLVPATTAAEVAAGVTILQANPWDVMDGVKVGTTSNIINDSASTYINYLFKRAPSFMDVVCYTGTGVATNFSHNLQAVPQLMFVKARTNAFATNWYVYNESLGATKTIFLDDDTSFATNAAFWNNTTPTSSVFTIGTSQDINSSGYTNIAYLFATCAGVSKVGSYTGNGTTQTIDCGITAGARFVLIRRTSSTGSWYVYDTARGMTTLTDPYWLADTTAAEVATLGSVTTVATGFAVDSAILAAINLNASTYLFLAIA